MKIGKNKGFTLLELVITIGIIAALVGLAVPYYQDYVSQSQNAVMRANLHILKKALMEYKSDKGTYPDVLTKLVPSYIVEIPTDPEPDAVKDWSYNFIDANNYSFTATKYNF